MVVTSTPMMEFSSLRTCSARLRSPLACSSISRSSRLTAKVTPAALMACRSIGASRCGITSSSEPMRSPLVRASASGIGGIAEVGHGRGGGGDVEHARRPARRRRWGRPCAGPGRSGCRRCRLREGFLPLDVSGASLQKRRAIPREKSNHGRSADQRRSFARRHPLQARPVARRRPLHRPLQVAAQPGLRARGVRHQLRGQLDVGQGAHGPPGRDRLGRRADRPHDARHRRLLDQRGGRGQRACHQARRRRRADAAAVLLQGRAGGGAVPLLLGGRAAGRRRPPARLSLSHPAGVGGADHPQAGRAADEGLPQADRRHEGQRRRLGAHQEHDRRLRQGRLRRLLGQREAADRQHQVGRRGLHQRHRQHQSRARSPRPTRSTPRPRARSCRAGSTRCAASCRATS